jgi:hypothetical protein
MGSTVGPRYITGTIIATNAALDIRKVGFQPRKIKVFNKTTIAMMEWNDQMDAAGLEWEKTVSAGTRTLEVTNGITLLAGDSSNPPGFSIGAAADINDTTTEILVWEAWG